jgi:glycosyltransferase involved in cell wall biosynthesis
VPKLTEEAYPLRDSLRMLLFNLATDADDPILGFTTRWIWTLAARVHSMQVVTMRMGRVHVPDNVHVHSVGKELGYSEPRRALEFYKILARILSTDPVNACYAHMMPLFAVMGAPLLKARQIPIVTWYAHPQGSLRVRMAELLSNKMVTGVPESYPYRSTKVVPIGQGVDTELFSPTLEVVPDAPPMILCVGRLSAIKNHPTLLRALSLLRRKSGLPFRAVILGGPAGPEDSAYINSLIESTKELGLEDTVSWLPPVTLAELPAWYRRSTVHANMTPVGSAEKVVLEAMACCRPSLIANEGYRQTAGEYFGRLYCRPDDPEDLAAKLSYWLTLPRTEQATAGDYLRKKVIRDHNLEAVADRLLGIFSELQTAGGSLQRNEGIGT